MSTQCSTDRPQEIVVAILPRYCRPTMPGGRRAVCPPVHATTMGVDDEAPRRGDDELWRRRVSYADRPGHDEQSRRDGPN
eukprot:7146837-Prymnesium_polylepis.1